MQLFYISLLPMQTTYIWSILQMMNVFWVQWYKYFHDMKDEMLHSMRQKSKTKAAVHWYKMYGTKNARNGTKLHDSWQSSLNGKSN